MFGLSVFEGAVVVGLALIFWQLVDIHTTLKLNHKGDNNSFLHDDLSRSLDALQHSLDEIEKHTGRAAAPLYDQDAFDREHLVGRYAPPD